MEPRKRGFGWWGDLTSLAGVGRQLLSASGASEGDVVRARRAHIARIHPTGIAGVVEVHPHELLPWGGLLADLRHPSETDRYWHGWVVVGTKDDASSDRRHRMSRNEKSAGHKPGNAHQVHRTAKTAFGEAVRRGHLGRDPVSLARPPRMEDEEIEPCELEEAQKILAVAAKHRNGARWAIALVLGLRQGEVLGLRWADLDPNVGTLRVRENRLRPKYVHGCGEAPCGRRAGYCPQKVNKRKLTGPVKSRAGKRPMGVPAPLLAILTAQKVAQDVERVKAGDLWQNGDWVFATETGSPLNPNTDFHEWKDLIKEAGVRDARLHDARHTAATLLLILGSEGRTTKGLMGWSDPSMPARYQHLVKQVQTDIAKRQGDLVWGAPKALDAQSNCN